MLTSAFVFNRAHAEEAAAVPPSFPDEAHVINGCYVSTAAYITKFKAAYPAEQAVPIAVTMLNADGRRHAHTIALLTWHGDWWGRDEYFGVFALKRSAADDKISARLFALAESKLEQHAKRLAQAGRVAMPKPAPVRLEALRRAHEVATARQMLPFATEQFWLTSNGEDIPFLFFVPSPGEIAVYTPQNGTANACCAMTDGAEVVALVAARLGYAVEKVRRDLIPSTARTFAAGEAKGALVR